MDADVLYTGSDDGRVHVTRDGGATWTDVTANIEGLPPRTYVTRLVASHADAGRVYGLFDGHRNDDFAPYVFVSEDFGSSWRPLTSGLPETSVNALAEHPDNPMLLFLGNEMGLWVSVDAGASWVAAVSNLPTVPVDDIEIHPRENDLVLGTHGRGIWILDDITPLQYLTAGVLASSAYVFPVRQATSYNLYTPQGWTPGIWEAPNPDPGARIRYHLAEEADDVGLRITDATGNEIRALEASGQQGLNEVIWDLRLVEDDAAGVPMDPGPRVMPGVYIAELTTGDEVVQAEIVVRLDPRVELARRDLMVRHQAILDSYRLSGPLEQAEDALDTMDERLNDIESLLGEAEDVEGLMARVQEVRDTIDALVDALDEAGDGANAWNRIQGVSGPATADQLWQIERSWSELPPVIEEVNAVAAGAYADLLGQVYTDAARPAGPAPIPAPDRGG